MINLLEAARKAGQDNSSALAAALGSRGASPGASGVSAAATGADRTATSPAIAQALQAQALLSAYSNSLQAPMSSVAQLQALLPQIPTMNAAAAANPALSQRIAAMIQAGSPAAQPLTSPASQAALLQQLAAARNFQAAAPSQGAANTPAVATAESSSPHSSSNEPSVRKSAKKAPARAKTGGSKPKSKASAAATSATAASVEDANSLHPDMSNWPVEKLEKHVNLLEQHNRPVPYTLKLLLGNAKRKEEKRQAKRIANRKFAHISRTRKKAFVQELTQQNEQLKRHSMILSMLPDVVFVIGAEGDITFCSDRTVRVLRYGMEELVGRNMADMLAPASKDKLNTLIKQLLLSETSTTAQPQQQAAPRGVDSSLSPVVSQSSGGGVEKPKKDAVPAIEHPPKDGVFPMSVVNVKAATGTGAKDGSAAANKNDNAPAGTFVSNEDSGYSSLSTNDSGEEQTSSLNDSSSSFGRNQPIAPTWTICMKRKDQKEIWCEATLTVISNEQDESTSKSQKRGSSKSASTATSYQTDDASQPMKELLLSVRPLRSTKKRSKTSHSWSRKQDHDHKRPASSSIEEENGKRSKTSAPEQGSATDLDAIAKEREHNVSPNSDVSTTNEATATGDNTKHEDIAQSLLMMHAANSTSSSNE